jgi:uncharacterized protein
LNKDVTVTATYYVYSLKDPQQKPARVFYVGKGTGCRATEHLRKVYGPCKGKYIQDISNSGNLPIISKVVEELTEDQVLKIALELTSTFGTIESCYILYNTAIPKSIKRKVDGTITTPNSAVVEAQLGLKLLKDSITSLYEESPKGITNSDWCPLLRPTIK